MAQVKLDFDGLTKPEKLAKAQAVIAASSPPNPHFPNPQPGLLALSQAVYEAGLKTAAVAALRQQLKTAEEAETAQYATLDDSYRQWGATVQAVSGGDPNVITGAGFGVRSTARTPLLMTQPQDVNATAGEDPGEIDLSWEPVKGVRTYEVQYTSDPSGGTGWVQAEMRSRSRLPIPGLTSGTKYSFRVRAIGATDTGPWSSVLQKVAP